MLQITLDKKAFKALASDTRLDILKTLDGKKMGLKDISNATKLNKATLHEHLTKLHEADLVKRNERKGHKWVYYKLSWKAKSLLHPDNNKIVVMFSATFTLLFFGLIGIFNYVSDIFLVSSGSDMVFKTVSEKEDTINQLGREVIGINYNQLFLFIAVACLILFSILFVISIRKYNQNKTPKL